MQSRKLTLLSTTMVPLAVFAGVATGGLALMSDGAGMRPAIAACAPKKANPCAAAKCNPCAAAKKCNPCAAAKKCNPCAAKACNPCNPCNPCAAGGGSVGMACAVPRLQAAAKCNPCAAKRACNPCNPCAAKKACNPCAANACNPCGAGTGPDLSDAEAVKVYDCLIRDLKAAYAKSGNEVAVSYAAWPRYSKRAYVSATHGGRYVQNYANETGRAYGAFENAGTFPVGTALAKDSFSLAANGAVSVGPLFIMEKMSKGFNADSDDWRYTMIMPNGSVFGTTKGAGNGNVEFCAGCHMSVTPNQDSVMLVPKEYRVR